MYHIRRLHEELSEKTYVHGNYHAFTITDPKLRNIHKASVRDRLVHHAVHRKLYPFFDRTFISDSYACRAGRGTHKALQRFRTFSYEVSRNDTRTCWALKCDIRKFFASIDHDVLLSMLRRRIPDSDVLGLLEHIIGSFYSTKPGKGLPLGNLTSQLFVNIYMNEFDQFAKHTLKAQYYIRYADDMVFLSHDRTVLELLVPRIHEFLAQELKLDLHPKKLSIGTVAAGVDFLGWKQFPDHKVLRTVTKRRMLRSIRSSVSRATEASYMGMLRHGNAYRLKEQIEHMTP